MVSYSFRTTGLSIQTLEKVIYIDLLAAADQPHSNVEMITLSIDDDDKAMLSALFSDESQHAVVLDAELAEHFLPIYKFFSMAMSRFSKPDGTFMVPVEAIETAGDLFIPLMKKSHKLVTRISNEAFDQEGADIVGYRVMNHVINHTGPHRELVQMREVLVPASLEFGTTGRDDYDYWFPFMVVGDEICFCSIVGSPTLIKNLPEDNPSYKNVWTGRTFWLPTGDAQITYDGDNAIGQFEHDGAVNRFALTDTGAIPLYAPYLGIGELPANS